MLLKTENRIQNPCKCAIIFIRWLSSVINKIDHKKNLHRLHQINASFQQERMINIPNQQKKLIKARQNKFTLH
jgi:hypothetical protein